MSEELHLIVVLHEVENPTIHFSNCNVRYNNDNVLKFYSWDDFLLWNEEESAWIRMCSTCNTESNQQVAQEWYENSMERIRREEAISMLAHETRWLHVYLDRIDRAIKIREWHEVRALVSGISAIVQRIENVYDDNPSLIATTSPNEEE